MASGGTRLEVHGGALGGYTSPTEPTEARRRRLRAPPQKCQTTRQGDGQPEGP